MLLYTAKKLLFRMLKMIATSGFLTDLECTKFVFGRGSASDPAGGAYSALPRPPSGLRGPTSKGQGRAGERRKRGKGRRRGEEGKGEWRRRAYAPPCKFLHPP